MENQKITYNADTVKNKGYIVQDELGSGAFAIVYKAIKENDNSLVAIKMVSK